MPPEDLRYERFAPGPTLAPHVEHLWLVAAPPIQGVRSEILIPNGRPTILLCLGEPGWRLSPRDGGRVPNSGSVSGVLTGPLVLEQSGRSAYLGAQLHPWGIAAFIPGRSLVDATLPLRDWLGTEAATAWHRRTSKAPLGEEAVGAFGDLLAARLQPVDQQRLALVGRAVAAIDADPSLSVEALAADLGLSYSTLYRLFRGLVGLPPKQYAGIIRYYRLVGGLLAEAPDGGLAQLALMRGYYDQAHANRQFRRYTGVSQTEFRRTLNGIARLMHGG